MTTSKGWLGDWEEQAEERAPLYEAGTTVNPAETARLRYRDTAPAECAHTVAPATSPAVCPACGLVLS